MRISTHSDLNSKQNKKLQIALNQPKFIILYYEHILVTCAPVHLLNGQANTMVSLVHDRYPFGTRISFSCSTGYNLDTTGSNSSITCLTTGVWSHTTPRCNIGNGTILCPFTRCKLLLTALKARTFYTSTAKI